MSECLCARPMHRCETDVRATTIVPVPPALMSVNLAYYIEIPGRDTERFGRMSECASAVIRFVFAVAIAGENHFFPHPDSAKVLFHWEKISSIPPCPRGRSHRGTQAEANRMGGSYA